MSAQKFSFVSKFLNRGFLVAYLVFWEEKFSNRLKFKGQLLSLFSSLRRGCCRYWRIWQRRMWK